MALLLLTGTAQIWHLVSLMAVNGVGFALLGLLFHQLYYVYSSGAYA